MEKVWLKNYPADVPAEINPDVYSSIADMFERSYKKFPDRPAFTNLGSTMTYGELDQASTHFAAFLQNLGLQKGDRVAIMLPNVLQYPVAMFGILRAGLVVVNVNPLYTVPELVHQLRDAGASAIIVLGNFGRVVAQALAEVALKHVIVTQVGDLLGAIKGSLVNFVVKYIKKMVPAFNIPGFISFKNALSQGAKLNFRKPDLYSQDIAFLQYTGGTTGVAKGAALTHRNMLANVAECLTWVKSVLGQGSETIVVALPLYHIFSLMICCLTFVEFGGHGLLITNPRDIPGFIKELAKSKFSVFAAVNTLYNALLNRPEFAKLDFSNLKFSIAGGMALQHSVAEKWFALTGNSILEGYGLTEASPVITINPLKHDTFTGSIGMPIPSTEISIRDDEGKELGIGEIGELWVRGPQVMQGYWQKPEETKKVITEDGWLKTGDICRVDEKGLVYLVDRKKDMILVSGFNVYPNEVEDVIAAHPGVLEVGVVGVPSTNSGEQVKAFVVKKDPLLTKEALLAYLHQNLTRYKVPKIIDFRDELPKSPVGKILRRELRNLK